MRVSCLRKQLGTHFIRSYCSCKPEPLNVAVIGAAGGIGQPLSLLLKQSPLVKKLMLHDIVNIPGIVADLSHIETPTQVQGVMGPDNLENAVCGADIVIVPAGLPRKPDMSRDDLFATNASIARAVACAVAARAPAALLAIITNPVNSTVPICAEVLRARGVFEPRRLFGVSILDVVRANTFAAAAIGASPLRVEVPVIGGHSGATIVPLFSQAMPALDGLDADEIKALTERVQNGGTEVVKAKAGAGSATLSMAYAAARFTISLIRAKNGEENVVECAYVESKVTEASYFATPLLLGKCGIEKNLGLGELSCYEKELVEVALCDLKKEIKKGVDFVNED